MCKACDILKAQIEFYERERHVDRMTPQQELETSEEFRRGAEYGRSMTLQTVGKIILETT